MEESTFESMELGNLRLKLREGLEFELQEHGDKCSYVIHDAVASQFYQIGIPEYAVLSLLDGQNTLQQVIEENSLRFGQRALGIRDVVRITQWLLESGLAQTVDEAGYVSPDSKFILEQLNQQARQKAVSQANPLFVRIPFGDPDSFLRKITPWLGGLASKTFFWIWLGVISYACVRLFMSSELMTQSIQSIMAPNAWGWMLITVVGLKLVHELAHAIFCQRYGGRVKETGVVLILFLPLPYMDVTSSWGFASKWKRIAVAGAGMYVEIFLAACAAIAWSFADDPLLRFHLFNLMLMGTVTTLLFNANFLMRFDGYYIVSDLLGIPNLYQKGQERVHSLSRRYLLGVKENVDFSRTMRNGFIWSYGFLSLMWRILVCISLSILATSLLWGFGIILALLGVILWLGVPFFRFMKQWNDPASHVRPSFPWIVLVTLPVLSSCLFLIAYLPWPFHVSAPAIVEYESPSIVRAESPGKIISIHVESGQKVSPGELLVELNNRELEIELRILKFKREKSMIRERNFRNQEDIATYQAELATRLAIEEQIKEVEQRLDSLQIFAPMEGVIVGEDLSALEGRYVTTGQGLMQIIDESSKKVVASIGQEDFEVFSSQQTQQAFFQPKYEPATYSGKLSNLEAVAKRNIDSRLAAPAGGELSVRQGSFKANDSNPDFELVSTRFRGEMMLVPAQAKELRAGTLGHVRLEYHRGTVGERILLSCQRWIDSLWAQVR